MLNVKVKCQFKQRRILPSSILKVHLNHSSGLWLTS
jgi:hypothetical protein